jgi:hypothetical protein
MGVGGVGGGEAGINEAIGELKGFSGTCGAIRTNVTTGVTGLGANGTNRGRGANGASWTIGLARE